jgi:perosamine synthetase
MKYALSSRVVQELCIFFAGFRSRSCDEVIVRYYLVATATAVAYTGATPVFADIEKDSWCLDPESFEKNITKHTKAVIPVHLYGHPARMDRIMEIAHNHNLYILEDAAPSIGAEFQGKKTGTFGDFAAFSFQGKATSNRRRRNEFN